MGGNFSLDLARATGAMRDRANRAIRKIALECFSNVILRTPVDTGRARGNWMISTGRPVAPAGGTGKCDKSGAGVLAEVEAALAAWDPLREGKIFLSNGLSYIMALEYGHSKQAPNGMARLSVEEIKNRLGA